MDIPYQAQAALTIRAGYLALRRISDFFQVQYNPWPNRMISFPFEERNLTGPVLSSKEPGYRSRKDREQAWRDYSGWRVNYDTVLIALAHITMAPRVDWVSDRPARVNL